MKITVWVVSTCIPGETEPSLPVVFASEAEAEAHADLMLRGEWEENGRRDEQTDELLPYPGDWREAQDQIATYQEALDSGERWGQWEITSHHIEIGTTPFVALEDAIRELDEAADKFHVIHCNHPGERAGRAQGEDKAFCAEMADRMRAARDRARIGLAAAEADRIDAERWRALMSSQRLHFMGSAGFRHVPKNGDAGNRALANQTPIPRAGQPLHFGMEFWDLAEKDDRFPDSFERELLTVYVDEIRARSMPAAAAAEMLFDGWSAADSNAATAEGWAIFERSDGTLQIQADDEAGVFAHDGAALDFVAESAVLSPFHARALALHAEGDVERAEIAAEAEQ